MVYNLTSIKRMIIFCKRQNGRNVLCRIRQKEEGRQQAKPRIAKIYMGDKSRFGIGKKR